MPSLNKDFYFFLPFVPFCPPPYLGLKTEFHTRMASALLLSYPWFPFYFTYFLLAKTSQLMLKSILLSASERKFFSFCYLSRETFNFSLLSMTIDFCRFVCCSLQCLNLNLCFTFEPYPWILCFLRYFYRNLPNSTQGTKLSLPSHTSSDCVGLQVCCSRLAEQSHLV